MATPGVIALDGPVAAGKTAVGKLVAQRLKYRFIDTGSMYRAVTWLALEEAVPLEAPALAALAQRVRIRVVESPGGVRILVGERDVTDLLRSPKVEGAVSIVSQVLEVRQAMVRQQQEIAREGRIVMAGRDIGTVVLPDAELKVYLTASVQERARRRYDELRALGQKVSYEAVLAGLLERDRLDSQRAHSPLRAAADARIIDTDGVGLEQVVAEILALAERG
ncbi:MAG: (d)CMP kinase [Chloroflexota bacterium]|nr:(d)CMP kinase [Chloroflexota bacterium]